MKSIGRQLALIVIIILCSCKYSTGHAEMNQKTAAASILFRQFETVAYARTDVLFRAFSLTMNDVDSFSSLGLPYVEFVAGLDALGTNTKNDVEKNYGSVLVGAGNFSPPTGIGAFTSRKCYIGITGADAQPNLVPDFRRTSYESIDGRQVWTWSIPPPEGAVAPTTFWAAQIAASYFVMANNRRDFQDIANALSSPQTVNQLHIGIPGWDNLNIYSYWIHRGLHKNGAANPQPQVIEALTPDVNDISFFADVDARKAFLRVVSSDQSMKTTPNFFPAPELTKFQPQGKGIWQTAIPLSKDEAASKKLFIIFFRMGFGAYL